MASSSSYWYSPVWKMPVTSKRLSAIDTPAPSSDAFRTEPATTILPS